MRSINGNWRTRRTKEMSLAGWQWENVKKGGGWINGLIDILGDFVLFGFITRWIRFRLLERKGEMIMSRRKSDDSKLVDIHFRESSKRKKKLEEYAALNRVSLTQYIRDALDIRDIMTRNEFNLSDTDDVFDEYYEESEEENDDEYE